MTQKESIAAAIEQRRAYIPTVAIAVACVVTVCVGVWQARQMMRLQSARVRDTLLMQAAAIAQSIDPTQAKSLEFAPQDLTASYGERLQQEFVAASESLGLGGVWTVARRDSAYRFGPASWPPGHPRATPPGTPYQQPSTALERAFATHRPQVTTLYRDEFGPAVSAYVPVVQPVTEEVVLVVGVDLNLPLWAKAHWSVGTLSLGFTVIALTLLLLGWLVIRFRPAASAATPWWQRHTEAILCALVLLVLTLAVAWHLHYLERHYRNASFRTLAQQQTLAIAREMWGIRSSLNGLARSFQPNTHTSREEFAAYASRFSADYAIQAALWVPRVAANAVAAIEAEARADGLDGYRIWRGQPGVSPSPATADAVYFPLHYIEPFAAHALAAGFDHSSEPIRAAALQSALHSGMVSASEPLTLFAMTNQPPGFFVYQALASQTQTGAVAFAINLEAVVRVPMNRLVVLPGQLLTADLFQLTPGREPLFLTSTDTSHVAHERQPRWDAHDGDTRMSLPIFAFGKTYGVVMHASPLWWVAYPLRHGRHAALAGLSLTVVLTLFVSFLSRRRSDLEQEIRARTADLQDERNLLYALMDNQPDRIFFEDAESRFIRVSKMQALALGLASPTEAIGKTLAELCPGEAAQRGMETDREIIRTGRPVLAHVEQTVGSDGKVHWDSVSKAPIREQQGKVVGIVGIVRDITTQIEMQQHLQHVAKMDAVGRLAGGVAHDFNNLLQAVLGFTELLLLDVSETDRQYEDLKQIERAAKRAVELTRQLLTFSRKQRVAPQVTEINDMVRASEKVLQQLTGGDVTLTLTLAADAGSILADPNQIEQILMNLVVNARDAMPDGGRIEICTEQVTLTADDAMRIAEATAGHFVRLTVRDTGCGIDPEALVHIFEPFFTTKERGKGTGLGLSVIYGIVKQSRGWINVVTKQGEGTTFKLYFPASGKSAAPITPEPLTLMRIDDRSLRGDGKTILLVEDEAGVRNLAEVLLRNAGYTVYSCAHAAEALQRYEQHEAHIDLLFSDIAMAGQNGIDLALELRKRRPDLPVLLCSGYADNTVRWKAIKKENFGFIPKPYPTLALLQAIRATLSKTVVGDR